MTGSEKAVRPALQRPRICEVRRLPQTSADAFYPDVWKAESRLQGSV